MNIKIIFAGDGGQGLQTIANLLTQTAFANGFYVTDIPNFGLEQRGGVSLAFVQISNKEIVYPRFTKPDILLIMSEQARERTQHYIEDAEVLYIEDYLENFKQNQIQEQSYNIFFLGLLGKKLADQNIMNLDLLSDSLSKKLSAKIGWEENQKAFELGIKY
ncbi:MAG: 2-oxoacid:acceptor oxidoreductase family protein [bacterium]